MSARATLRSEFKSDDYRHDPWGTAISHLFSVCDVLSAAGEDIPASWEFRHGAYNDPTLEEMADDLGSDDPAYAFSAMSMAAYVLEGSISADDLRAWGNVLSRYCDVARANGHDY